MKASILILLLIFAVPAAAQPTMALWVDQGGQLVDDYDIPVSVVFEVVVTLDSDGNDVALVEWGMTDLTIAAPGLISLGMTSSIGSCGLLPETCMDGNYTIFVNGCHPGGGQVQIARLSFADFTGVVGPDIVATIGPRESGGIPGSSGFFDCSDAAFAAPMGGSSGGTTSSGVTWPPGGLILNPTRPIPVDEPTLSAMKSRY